MKERSTCIQLSSRCLHQVSFTPQNRNNVKHEKKKKFNKDTREGNFIEVRRTNDKIIPMGRPFVWPDKRLWGGKSLFIHLPWHYKVTFTLSHPTPEAEDALSNPNHVHSPKQKFQACCDWNAALWSTDKRLCNQTTSGHTITKRSTSRFPYRKLVESSLSKRLIAIFKTECFN